jgi:diaminopimelate epimerase
VTAATLTKHHGLGNDFLVLILDAAARHRLAAPDLARAICDRRRGIGADGLLLAEQVDQDDTEADVGMTLFNADGSRAEMSGNGIRCLAQAWSAHVGLVEGVLRVRTDAGIRLVTVWPTDDSATIMASVAMGAVTALAAPENWAALACDALRPVAHLSLGNPHSVVAVDDVEQVDLAALGAEVPQVNLEIVHGGPQRDAITMRVHERGAGITEACGTGACAAAVAAARWGLVDRATTEITVHMVGGDAKVRLDDPVRGHVTLVGPATAVGTITVDLDELAASAAASFTGL